MKIGLRAGHSPNCLGAVGLRNEHKSMMEFFAYVREVFENYNHTVIDCNSNANSPNTELYEGVVKANNAGVDLFISLHMNSCNGQAFGTEALTYGEDSRANSYAKNLLINFSKLGFFNRGLKFQPTYFEMKNVKAPNIIFEVCFCDSKKDIDIWSKLTWEQLAYAFGNSIDSNIPFNPSKEANKV